MRRASNQTLSGGNGRRARRRIGRAAGAWAIALAGVCALPSAAWAQAATIRQVGFDAAIELALERNPTVATASAAITESQALLDISRAYLRPSVGFSLNNVTLDSQRGFDGGVTQPRNQFAFGASASLPLLQALRSADVTQARDQVELAGKNLLETRRQIATSTALAYLAVIASRRQVDVDLRALEAARAHLEYADRRLEGGVGSRLNQLRAAQVVSDLEARLENMRHLVRRAQEALGVLVAENGPVDAGEPPVFEQPAPGAEVEWMAARPDLAAQAIAVRSADVFVRDTRKAWWPTATAAFEPTYITPTSLFQPSRSWRLVFAVSQPLFQPGVKAETSRRTVLLDRAQLAQKALEIQARSEIRLAEEQIQSRQRALVSARLAADQANEVLRISTAAFEVGSTTNIEVIDAQRSARDAEALATLEEDALRRARLDLLVALGRFPR